MSVLIASILRTPYLHLYVINYYTLHFFETCFYSLLTSTLLLKVLVRWICFFRPTAVFSLFLIVPGSSFLSECEPFVSVSGFDLLYISPTLRPQCAGVHSSGTDGLSEWTWYIIANLLARGYGLEWIVVGRSTLPR